MTDHALHPHTAQPPLRPANVADFLELVPYIMGFHPSDSLVLAALHRPRRRVGATMRVDLDQARGCEELSRSLAGYLRRDGVTEALAVVYAAGTPEAAVRGPDLPERQLVDGIGTGLAAGGVCLVDAIYVSGDRWWSYACRRADCCPPDGRQLPGGAGKTSAAVAAATYAGMVALPSREALERTLDPDDQVTVADMEGAQHSVDEERARARAGPDGPATWRRAAVGTLREAVVEHLVAGEPQLDAAEVARLLALLDDDVVRDECCHWIDGEFGAAASRLWRQLARRAVGPYDVTPCVLVAWSAWHSGSGPLARIAVDRALARDPTCRLALLLEEALDRGVSPTTLRGRQRGRRRNKPRRQPRDEEGR